MRLRGLLGHERRLKTCLAVALMSGAATSLAAHPHVWATVRSEIVFGPDQKITGIRHAWTFDEFYTAMAVEGLDTDKDGTYSKEELAPLAKVNVESLKEFAISSSCVAVRGEAAAAGEPIDRCSCLR